MSRCVILFIRKDVQIQSEGAQVVGDLLGGVEGFGVREMDEGNDAALNYLLGEMGHWLEI